MVRPAALLATGGVFCLVVGYVIGRLLVPARIEEREKVITKVVEVQTKQKEETRRENDKADLRENVKWKIREIHYPNGSVERTAEGERGRSSESEKTREEARRETEIRYVDKIQTVEKLKIVEAEKAKWALGVHGGYSLHGAQIYGATVERRILGPAWVGIFANTSKAAGLSVRVEW